jgi:protein involved in polysaccharide export with SLBB domain
MNLRSLSLPLLIAALPAFPVTFNANLAKSLLSEQEGKFPTPPEALSPSDRLDNSLNPDLYIVGGGDGFQIAIKGLPSQDYEAMVNSDGNIYLGDFGEINIGKVSLRQAVKSIQDKVRTSLGGRYQAYVVLKRRKHASVTVTGGIYSPGTYTFDGGLRILDALKKANKDQVPAASDFNLRRVEVRNGGVLKTYDLLRSLATDDESQNPYVYPGDRIEIKFLDETVFLGGRVFGPFIGKIPFNPGETLADLIPMFNYRASSDTTYFLVRKAGKGIEKLPRSDAKSFVLGVNDVITIPEGPNEETQDTVRVSGEVARRGTYPIRWGKTTVAEVLEWAGGATGEADMRRAFVVRYNKLPPAPNPANASQLPTGPAVFKNPQVTAYSVRPEIQSSLNDLYSTNDFAVIKVAGHPESIPLEGGDLVQIPRRENFVYVSGQVKKPGAYPFKDGESVSYYVDLAGGYSSKADPNNKMVMQRFNEIVQIREDGGVQQGDVVVVPTSVENKRLNSIYLPVTQALISVLSLAISIIILGKQ